MFKKSFQLLAISSLLVLASCASGERGEEKSEVKSYERSIASAPLELPWSEGLIKGNTLSISSKISFDSYLTYVEDHGYVAHFFISQKDKHSAIFRCMNSPGYTGDLAYSITPRSKYFIESRHDINLSNISFRRSFGKGIQGSLERCNSFIQKMMNGIDQSGFYDFEIDTLNDKK